MGFNKRYISEDSIRLIANNDDVERFFNYFKSDTIISCDKFSSKVFNTIRKYSISDKDKIINEMGEVMNEVRKAEPE